MTPLARATITLLGVGLLAFTPRVAFAQLWRTNLNVAGWPLTVTQTSGADFENGFVTVGTTSFTVDASSNLFNVYTTRITTVSVLCLAACPRSGTLPLAGLQWRRDDQVTWNTLTTTAAQIEQRTLTYNGTNDPWSRTVHWRYVLNWTANPPTPATTYRIQFQLTVAAP